MLYLYLAGINLAIIVINSLGRPNEKAAYLGMAGLIAALLTFFGLLPEIYCTIVQVIVLLLIVALFLQFMVKRNGAKAQPGTRTDKSAAPAYIPNGCSTNRQRRRRR